MVYATNMYMFYYYVNRSLARLTRNVYNINMKYDFVH